MTDLEHPTRVLGAEVRAEDAFVGVVTGVLGDASFERVIGLEVTGPDGRRSLLPWVAATVVRDVVTLSSRLVLIDGAEIESYVRLGARVVRDPAEIEPLSVAANGSIRRADGPRGVSSEAATGTRCP